MRVAGEVMDSQRRVIAWAAFRTWCTAEYGDDVPGYIVIMMGTAWLAAIEYSQRDRP